MNRFKGKVALVTGGSRGIGAAIVQRLAAEGASVAFTYASSAGKANSVADEINAVNGKAKAYYADACHPASLANLAEEVVKDFGKIDILVNNAGILEGYGTIDALEIDAFDRTMDINVKSVFTLTHEVAKTLSDGGEL